MPISSTDRLSATDGILLSSEDATEYRNIVGGLQYLTITRLDLSFAVNRVCQYLHAPTDMHWSAVKLHLVMCVSLCLLDFTCVPAHPEFFRPSLMLTGLVVEMTGDLRGGYAVFLGPNLIAWRARKQATVSRRQYRS
jgi:histone deacetylase 1/2